VTITAFLLAFRPVASESDSSSPSVFLRFGVFSSLPPAALRFNDLALPSSSAIPSFLICFSKKKKKKDLSVAAAAALQYCGRAGAFHAVATLERLGVVEIADVWEGEAPAYFYLFIFLFHDGEEQRKNVPDEGDDDALLEAATEDVLTFLSSSGCKLTTYSYGIHSS